ncbi:Heat shock protein HtpX [Candidatus Johnevansia muelleri]|uniref:Heat shock protein HtpX n=1 Tax=Candidatus Johnevansia muelleri TaxID=1495769 RepID=A0A078KBM1_9GAMM|nr:Heat shock protein HtpX [Candidatus Evansia muelleri]
MFKFNLCLLMNISILIIFYIILKILGIFNILNKYYLIFIIIYGFIGSLISLLYSKYINLHELKLIKTHSNLKEKWLIEAVKKLSYLLKIKTPDIGIFKSKLTNAYATGWHKNHSLIAFSDSLLINLNKNEISAVICHEMAHIITGDMITLGLLQGTINVFVILVTIIIEELLLLFIVSNKKLNKNKVIKFIILNIQNYTYVFINTILGIISQMILSWFSRTREFRADAISAKLIGKENMIGVLNKLKLEKNIKNTLPKSILAFGINDGKQIGNFLNYLLNTHPPIDDRINELKKLKI